MYNILEARIEYKDGILDRITVLVEISTNDVRAIFATGRSRSGYMHLLPDAEISDELLQEVAGYGMATVDRDETFKGWKTKYTKPKL